MQDEVKNNVFDCHRPGAEGGGLGWQCPPQPQYYRNRALPTNKKKEKRIYKISPEYDQDPLGNNPPRDDYRPPAQFLFHVGTMSAAMPPPEIESQLRAWTVTANACVSGR